jgi:toxin ParE1/3/4
MSSRPVVPREQARRDIEDAVDHYAREAGEKVALGFVNDLEVTLSAIGRNPGLGSPRFAYELDLPGLRARRLRRYPYLIFYIETDHRIDVWRVLHGSRDIPAWLRDPDER